jgi:hypothetical protein
MIFLSIFLLCTVPLVLSLSPGGRTTKPFGVGKVMNQKLDLISSIASRFGGGGGGGQSKQRLKSQILSLASSTKRGLTETGAQRMEMLSLFEKLEKLSPAKQALKSPLTAGTWLLRYTTSDSILGKGGSPRVGEIVQVLDVQGLKASNAEIVQYGPFKLERKVKASLTPVGPSEVAVQFEEFSFAFPSTPPFLKVKSPASFKGRLDVTYIDSDLRLSRGDKGNIFVLEKASDDTTL